MIVYTQDIRMVYGFTGVFHCSDIRLQVMVTHPDGTAAAGKNITVSINNFRAGQKYEKEYMSNDKGEIFFTLPPVMEDKKSFTISVSYTSILVCN